jgi:hypothetical protein
MISIERTKELLGKPEMPDEETEKIRDSVRTLVEIIFEQWEEDKNEKNKKNIDISKA